MSVCCECCVLSGRCLCDGLITRPEEPYRLCCVSNVCDHETSTKRGGPGPDPGPGPYRAVEQKKKTSYTLYLTFLSIPFTVLKKNAIFFHLNSYFSQETGWFSRYSNSYRLDGPGFESLEEQVTVPFYQTSKLALCSNQPPIKWLLGLFSRGLKGQECGTNT
jgi:hypothetical protein